MSTHVMSFGAGAAVQKIGVGCCPSVAALHFAAKSVPGMRSQHAASGIQHSPELSSAGTGSQMTRPPPVPVPPLPASDPPEPPDVSVDPPGPELEVTPVERPPVEADDAPSSPPVPVVLAPLESPPLHPIAETTKHAAIVKVRIAPA